MKHFVRSFSLLLCAALLCGCARQPDSFFAQLLQKLRPGQAVSAPAPEPEPTPAPTPTPDPAELCLASLTLEQKLYQLFIVAPEQLLDTKAAVTTPAGLADALAARPVGGLIFFASNLKDRQQTTELLAAAQNGSAHGLLLAVDEEGGTVARLGSNPAMGTTAFSAMQKIGDTGDVEQARAVGRTLGNDLRALGFTLDFAPVADVDTARNSVIGKRAFSRDPAAAAAMVSACVQGFGETPTLCTLKHFPGHGDTKEDSHTASAFCYKTLDELRACEFLPFAAGISAGADAVMVGHISCPAVTGRDTPAILDPALVGLLREELGFEGLIVTDSMQMQAITKFYDAGTAAKLAIQAGCDLLLMPQDLTAAVEALRTAVESGELPQSRIDESVLRILRAKQRSGVLK